MIAETGPAVYTAGACIESQRTRAQYSEIYLVAENWALGYLPYLCRARRLGLNVRPFSAVRVQTIQRAS